MRRLSAKGALACMIVALSAAPAWATPTNTRPPVIKTAAGSQASPQFVLGQFQCGGDKWTGTNPGDNVSVVYRFVRDGTPITRDSLQPYEARSADIGHQLSCVADAFDNTDHTAASQPASNSITIIAFPTLGITRYHNTVLLKVGAGLAGQTMRATLERVSGFDANPIYRGIAGTSGTVSGAGAVSLTLAPVNPSTARTQSVGDPGDAVLLQYPGALQLSTAPDFNPLDGAMIAGDGLTAALAAYRPEDCPHDQFVDNKTVVTTTFVGAVGSGECQGSFPAAVTDQAHVQFKQGIAVQNGRAGLALSEDVALIGLTGGAPKCVADLVTRFVRCTGLRTGGTFALTRVHNGSAGAPVAFGPITSGAANTGGATITSGFVHGDTIRLTQTGPSPQGGTRVLTTLTVFALRLDLAEHGASGPATLVSGSCDPNKLFTGLQAICPSSGTLSPSTPYGFQEADDGSGGATQLTVPDAVNTIPGDNQSEPTNFHAWLDLDHPQFATATLQVFQRRIDGSNGASVFGPSAIDLDNGIDVRGLAGGRYNATWKITDLGADTRTVATQFNVQPGTAPAASLTRRR